MHDVAAPGCTDTMVKSGEVRRGASVQRGREQAAVIQMFLVHNVAREKHIVATRPPVLSTQDLVRGIHRR